MRAGHAGYRITVRDDAGERTYHAVGDRNALMDAAYDAGALGIVVRSLA